MDALHLVISLVNGFSSVISIISNAFVFVAIVKTSSLHTPTNVLLCSLAASDFAVGLIVQPLFITCLVPPFHKILHRYFQYAFIYFAAVSLTTLALISLDRFLAIYWHLRYHAKVTVKRIGIILATVWLSFVPIVVIYFKNGEKSLMRFYFSVAFLMFISFIILFCHFSIYKIVRRHRRQIAAQRQALRLPTPVQGRSIRTMWYIQGLCVICVIPYLCCKLLTRLFIGGKYFIQPISRVSLTILFVNSSLNPYLYCYRSREIKNVVLSMVKRCLCRNKATEIELSKPIQRKQVVIFSVVDP